MVFGKITNAVVPFFGDPKLHSEESVVQKLLHPSGRRNLLEKLLARDQNAIENGRAEIQAVVTRVDVIAIRLKNFIDVRFCQLIKSKRDLGIFKIGIFQKPKKIVDVVLMTMLFLIARRKDRARLFGDA